MAITESTSSQQHFKLIDGKNHMVQNMSNPFQSIMDPEPIDFEECFKDSPKYRHTLKDNLTYMENLESCMTKTIKYVNHYIETGKEHIKSQKDLICSMKSLNSLLAPKNEGTFKRVNTLLETLDEIMRLHEIVIDQSSITIGSSLTKVVNDDLVKLKEARKSFDKISHDFDQALTKYSLPVKKQQDDTKNLLIATSTAFTHTSLDLSIQVSTLQSKKRSDLLGSLLSFTKVHSTFFHQGYDLFEDMKPHLSEMDEYLNNIQDDFETLIRNLPSKHLMVSNNELRPLSFDKKSPQVHLEGYLFKRASNGFKVWNRRWFILKDHQLLYQKRSDTNPTVIEEDIRLLTVRPVDKSLDTDRRHCFEILSPHKSHILQADSDSACKTWIEAIQGGINAAFHEIDQRTIPKTTSNEEELQTNWSSGFSFKALQQATNRLNPMGTPIVTDESTAPKKSSKNKNKSSNGDTCEVDQMGTQGNFVDYDDCNKGFKVDEQGRSYAPLKADEDDDNDDYDNDECTNSSQQKKAGESSQIEQPSNIVAATYPRAATEYKTTQASSSSGPPEKPQRAYMIILAMPGNDQCADCEAAQPLWASINLGITLCIECAGIHRSLGVHLSKVRSLTLDTEVWSPDIVRLMLSLGNTSVNSAYLACYREQIPMISADSSRAERENWIKNKYLLKSFMRPPDYSPPDKPDELSAADQVPSRMSESHQQTGEQETPAKTEEAEAT